MLDDQETFPRVPTPLHPWPRTVARKSSTGGALRLCRGAWHSNLTNIPLT